MVGDLGGTTVMGLSIVRRRRGIQRWLTLGFWRGSGEGVIMWCAGFALSGAIIGTAHCKD